MYLVPVIQLGIKIEITSCHQILMRHLHLPECRLSKTLSNSKIRHEVVEIANKMCWIKCINRIKRQHTDFCLVDLLYLPGYYNSTPCIPAPKQMLLLSACHIFSIAFHHRCHLMKMITCSQCNWLQFVVRYLALLNEKNHVIVSEFCRCLHLLWSHVHIQCLFFIFKMYTWIELKFLILECYMPVATRRALSFVTCFDLQWATHQDYANATIPLKRTPEEVDTMFRSLTWCGGSSASLTFALLSQSEVLKLGKMQWFLPRNTLVVLTLALFRMVGATVAAALARDMKYNLHAKLCARWDWSLLKLFPQAAQQALDVDIPVDWDNVQSDEKRTQILKTAPEMVGWQQLYHAKPEIFFTIPSWDLVRLH